MEIRFFVPGIPKPGGSKIVQPIRRKGGAVVMYKDKRGNDTPLITVRDASKNQDWKASVSYAARGAMAGLCLLAGPLIACVIYYMPRPKYHYRTNGQLKPNAPKYHEIEPDADKLIRSTQDAMTGIVWRNDGQIAFLEATKLYDQGQGCGAAITIRQLKAVV